MAPEVSRFNERLRPFGSTIFADITSRAVAAGAINLGQGFPNFDGPDFVKEAAIEAIHRGMGQYAPTNGLPDLVAALRSRGASHSEAADLIADLVGDCFGGERAKGGLHRLLARYNGSCPLPAFLRHVALHRLIDLKRKLSKRKMAAVRDDDDEDPLENIAAPGGVDEPADTSLIALLRTYGSA